LGYSVSIVPEKAVGLSGAVHQRRMEMKKLVLVALALVLCLTAVNLANAEPSIQPAYSMCAVIYTWGTGPVCNCVIHCGNNTYWGGSVPSDTCAAIYGACCNGWGNSSCS
jgi:hypothetical protein